ncbi:MAG: EI24 domain-containing protein [Bacteroidales bacterium]|nr:EI24 domain-containing protein [Bacteroidales bacterium]
MITAKEQITTGFQCYKESFGFIFRNGLGKYFVVPVIVNILLVILLVSSGWFTGDWVSSLWDSTDSAWLGFLQEMVKWVITVLFFVLFFFIGGTIVVLCMSPIYTIISEKTDCILSGRTFETSAAQTAKDIWRTVVLSLKNTVKQLMLTLLCLLLNFIPIVGNVLSLVLIFLVNSYYFGYSFMDYTNERYRRNVSISNNVVSHYKYLAIVIGAVYALPMYFFVGTFIAAFLGGVSTVAATMAQMRLENSDADIHKLIQ